MRPAGSLPVTIAGTTTSEQVLLTNTPPATPLVVGISPGTTLDSKVLRGSIAGWSKLAAAGNFTVNVYAGRSPIIAQNTQLGTFVFAQPIGVAPWAILIPAAIYNAVQGKMMGSFSKLDATLGAPAAAAGWLAAVPLTGDPAGGALAYLSLTFTFAAAAAGNLAALTDFVLDT